MKRIEVKDVTDMDIISGGNIEELLPPYDEIPIEFKLGRTKWNKLVTDWFFNGIEIHELISKEGIDPEKAFRHIQAIMSSFIPKHQHKEAGCAFLLNEFFEDIKYEVR